MSKYTAAEEKINHYWSERAESYSVQNRQQMEVSYEKWKNIMQPYLPEKGKKVLDVGTGPGFLAILLAKEGYDVTAVDCNEKMLEQAKINAKENGVAVKWIKTERELPFEPESFDFIVSRDVLWMQMEPEEILNMWYRTCKKGGKILYFDAEWYDYLRTEERHKEYREFRKKVRDQKGFVYSQEEKMEELAYEMPLTYCKRPEWDREFWIQKRPEQFQCETMLNSKIYSQIEQIQYAKNSEFLIYVQKWIEEIMKRIKNILKKIAASLLQTVAVLIGITLITFFILYMAPGNPAEIWLTGGDANVGQISEEAIKAQEEKMGLDKPFFVQYGNWLAKVCKGDMGISMSTSRPVAEELAEHIIPTLQLTFTSLLLTILISVPLGIYCAVYKDRWLDNIVRSISFIGISMPSFFISLLLLWYFCLEKRIFTIIATEDWKGMVLPTAVLVIQCSSKLTRQVRAVVLEQLSQEYVKGAVARGVSEIRILFSHVLKNCLIPILTWCSIYFGIMLGGSAVIETIFTWNGVGKMAVDAVARLDYYLIQGFVLWIAAIFLAVNFLLDFISAIIDPRIKER